MIVGSALLFNPDTTQQFSLPIMNTIEKKESDSSSTNPMTDNDKQEPSLNSYKSPKTDLNTQNPFDILLPLSKMFQSQSYTNHQSYPIAPHGYFANIGKYTAPSTGINYTISCTICGDTSSGKHYGILSCNGCSGFFKRSVRRKLIYRCQANTGKCIIDKTHRNQCQACRLKKCLQMGMIKEAVQNERQRRNSVRTRVDSSDYHYDAGRIIPAPSQETNFTSGSSASESSISSITKQTDEDDTVYIASSQILLMIIKWIRNLPTFSNLPIHDQLILLEESWSELFLLLAIQYSISLDNGGPLFSHILHSENENDRLINDIFHIFKQLKLDPIEFACLKGIILFRCDTRTLNEIQRIENLQDQAQLTLAQFLQLHNPTQPTRFGRLLLTLPLLRSIPSLIIEKTYFSRTIGRISMSKLLIHMFKN